MSESTKITLVTEDGQKVMIERQSAQQIGSLKSMLNTPGTTFPVPAVKSTILNKVIEFLDQHVEDPVLSLKQSQASPDPEVEDEDDPDVSALSLESQTSSSSDDEYVYEDYLANVTPWDQRFLDALDLPTLIELTKAANYLNIPNLLDLCCRTIAKQMTGLKAEELRKKFNLPNDFTPEEEAKMAAEFAWIEE